MASLHKRPNSSKIHIAYTDASGKRILRSARTSDEKVARKMAEKIEEAVKAAKQKSLSIAMLRRQLDEVAQAAGIGELKQQTVESFFKEWLDSRTTRTSPKTHVKYIGTAKEFLKALGNRAEAPLETVGIADANRYQAAQLRNGLAKKTTNAKVKILKAAFSYARRQQWILANPFDAIEMLDAEKSDRRPFTLEEVERLLETADLEWCGMILLAAFAGLRLTDVKGIKWEQIDLRTKVLRYVQEKTKKQLVVPLHDGVAAYFNALQRALKGSEPVFSRLSQVQVNGCNGLSARFKNLMKKAGISDEKESREDLGRGRNRSRLSFHSLRHTFITEMLNKNVSPEMRMKLAGHSSKVHELYSHHEINNLRAAVGKIDGISVDWMARAGDEV